MRIQVQGPNGDGGTSQEQFYLLTILVDEHEALSGRSPFGVLAFWRGITQENYNISPSVAACAV
jgi:hypothetical protein